MQAIVKHQSHNDLPPWTELVLRINVQIIFASLMASIPTQDKLFHPEKAGYSHYTHRLQSSINLFLADSQGVVWDHASKHSSVLFIIHS